MAIVEECLVVFKQLHEQQYKSYPNQSIQVNYAVFFSSEYNAKRYLKIIQSLGGTSRVKALLSVYNYIKYIIVYNNLQILYALTGHGQQC